MKIIDTIALILVIIGAINWGLIGLFDFNLVSALFGDMTTITRIIYSLVGISALASMFILPNCETHKDEYCKCDI